MTTLEFSGLALFIFSGTVLFLSWLWLASPRKRRGPITDHVLLLPLEVSETIGGMQLPENQKERPAQGIVVAIGPGKVTEQGIRVPPEVAKGDRVNFPSYAGLDQVMDIGEGDKLYRLVRQDEISYNHGPQEKVADAE